MWMNVMRAGVGRSAARSLRRLLDKGQVGTITHVTFVNHRPDGVTRRDVDHGDYVQLRTIGTHDVDILLGIFRVNPVSVMARCTAAPWREQPHGTTTEAMLELEGDIHVQYHGSLFSNRDEYWLRIDGERGVLQRTRFCVWWRKRGWPLFVPIRFGGGRTGDADTKGGDSVWTSATVAAVIQSDRSGQRVRIADLFSAAGVASGSGVVPN
jgi:predicted dehydrogenase